MKSANNINLNKIRHHLLQFIVYKINELHTVTYLWVRRGWMWMHFNFIDLKWKSFSSFYFCDNLRHSWIDSDKHWKIKIHMNYTFVLRLYIIELCQRHECTTYFYQFNWTLQKAVHKSISCSTSHRHSNIWWRVFVCAHVYLSKQLYQYADKTFQNKGTKHTQKINCVLLKITTCHLN